MPTTVGLRCYCCNRCCTLCSGKACNEGVTFGGNWTGASGAGAAEANVSSSGWVNPWVGGLFGTEIDVGGSENAAADSCVYVQVLDDVSYVDDDLGSVIVYYTPTVTFYIGATSGHLFAVFSCDFAFPHSGGATLYGEADLGEYEEQDCSTLSVAISLTFTPGTNDVSDYINPPTTFTVTASHDA